MPPLLLFLILIFLKYFNIFHSCSMLALSCSMWDLASCPGIDHGPPALWAESLNHWTTREVPLPCF